MVKLPSSGESPVGDPVRIVEVSDRSGIVLDGGLLFSADFIRLGDDLLLRGADGADSLPGTDGADILLRGYFAQLAPPPLQTAEGAQLAPETVEVLAGPAIPLSLAQAGEAPLAAPIGEVSSLDGIARVQRADGTRGNLHEGDPIFQGDVVSTGVGSDLGIVFVDDTVFSLSANARMVIDELIYNPSSTSNAMGVSLIQGTFVFVTGKVAPSGEMDVETPVGTIGIRGTTVGVRIATFSGATRIANIENPETGETGRFTFSNFGGSAQFTQGNHFLEIRSADASPGTPALISSQTVSEVFGRPLSSATEIQRSIERGRTDERPTAPEGTDQQQGEAVQQPADALSQPPVETAGADQPLGAGSGFAAGLTLEGGQDVAAGLVASSLLATGPLSGVDIAGFGIIAADDSFTFLLPPAVEDEPPPVNVVFLIDISGSMGRATDGGAPSPSSPSRLDLAGQALLALNQQLIDAGLADRVTVKIIAFRADTDIAVIDASSMAFDRPDDGGLAAFVDGLRTGGGTQYEGPLQVAANWLREDVDPGSGVAERHQDSLNFIFLFSDGDEAYLPDASLVADLYDDGSGTPAISNLTIEAFGLGEPGAPDFSADQLGKVETGSLGHGDQVTIISDAGDIEDIFQSASSGGQASEDPEAANLLQVADLVEDDGDLGIDALPPDGGLGEANPTAEPVRAASSSLPAAQGVSLADLAPEDPSSLA